MGTTVTQEMRRTGHCRHFDAAFRADGFQSLEIVLRKRQFEDVCLVWPIAAGTRFSENQVMGAMSARVGYQSASANGIREIDEACYQPLSFRGCAKFRIPDRRVFKVVFFLHENSFLFKTYHVW